MTGDATSAVADRHQVWVAVVGSIVLMAAYLVARDRLEGPVEVVLAIVLVAATVGAAWWAGASLADLGLRPVDLGSGAAWGLAIGAGLAALIVAVSWVPAADDFFADERYSDLDGGQLAFEALVRVPIGTALFEELLFRGVLLGLALMVTGRLVAVISSSVLFGLWHVFAATDFADTNDGVGSTAVLAVVAGTVLVTGVAGAALAWLRLRSRSVLAPTIVHAAVNSTALLVAAANS
ncbi:MAG: CPBP family intramembrane glutamic endopeptidase [Ilumatobacteraceae bacterium]